MPMASHHSPSVWTVTEAADERAPAVVRSADDGPPARPASAGASVAPRSGPASLPALADVYREHAPYVWRVLRRLGVAPADLEDACQEVFLIVHRKLPTFEQRSSVRTWLYGIAVRHAADHRRRVRRAPSTSTVTPDGVSEPAVDAAQPDSVARREARALLDAILDDLDQPKRAVFVLYELEELTMAEVALAVGCPLQTAYSRLQAARACVEAAVHRQRAKEHTR
jgi:RNA polymerase sigma-70 factor (ECF subfamily)